MTHIQITWGHAGPDRGWEVQLIYLGGKIINSCNSREEAETIYKAIVAAYELGKDDLRKDLSNLLTLTVKDS